VPSGWSWGSLSFKDVTKHVAESLHGEHGRALAQVVDWIAQQRGVKTRVVDSMFSGIGLGDDAFAKEGWTLREAYDIDKSKTKVHNTNVERAKAAKVVDLSKVAGKAKVVEDLIANKSAASITLMTPPCPWSSSQTHNLPDDVPFTAFDDALLVVDLLHFLLKPSVKKLWSKMFLYESAGPRCYKTDQPGGGETPFVQISVGT
jgi:hypothetical protein